MAACDAQVVYEPSHPLNAGLTLGKLQHGGGDPCQRRGADGALWRTSRMPGGPVTCRITQPERGAVAVQAWGPGADELVATVPALLGAADRPETFDPQHPILHEAVRRTAGLRVPRSGLVLDSLIPAILEQKVLGLDATAAWRTLVMKYGAPPPGPAPSGMRIAPTAKTWRDVPAWDWHRAGVEERRASTARRAAAEAAWLQRAADRSPDDPAPVYRRLVAIPGVGRWTAAEVGCRALGDADALPIGDYHLPALTSWSLAGRTLAEDELEAFYEPWRGHRFRVVRLLELTPGSMPPRRGARMSRQQFSRI